MQYAMLLVFVLAASYCGWFWLVKDQVLSENTATWGSFGDYIGGIMNPVVALLALYWLTQSISIQKQELHDTRLVLEGQAKASELKRFEDTFFALLSEHNSLLSGLKEVPQNVMGFNQVHTRLFSRTNRIEEAKDSLEDRDNVVGHYFRLLFQILKFVAIKCPETTCTIAQLVSSEPQTKPSESEKFYTNILRAALDTRASQLLAINCYATSPDSSFYSYRRLIERYAFLEHMPFVVNGHDPHQALLQAYEIYDQSAFGRSDYVEHLKSLGYFHAP